MKIFCSASLLLALIIAPVLSQKTAQTISGTITDVDSKLPLKNAMVIVGGTDPAIICSTDTHGNFSIDNMPFGRKTIKISCSGYEVKTIRDIEADTGHEVVLNLSFQKIGINLDSGTNANNETQDKITLVSTHSISPKETKYYAGCDGQTAIITTSFAGIGSTQNAEHDIIVRGNSPKYMKWYLEGAEIVNPYHWADQNSTGNGMLALNNNMLTRSNFYTGVFSPEYGNVLSGIYDVKLRTGDSTKFRAAARLNDLYSDYVIEGPIKKGYAGSYIVNYRYYHLRLMIKLADVPESRGISPSMQDATFKVVLPTQDKGTFTIFGLGGLSNLSTTTNAQAAYTVWQTPDNRSMSPNIAQALDYGSYLGNIGITHALSFRNNSSLKTSILFSGNGNKEDVYESTITKTDDGIGSFVNDTVGRDLNYSSNINSIGLTGSMTYSYLINAKNKLKIGSVYSLSNYQTNQNQLENDTPQRFTMLDFHGNVATLRNFISWKYNFIDQFALDVGLHNMNVRLNNKSTLEPRIALSWMPDRNNTVYGAFGKYSSMESFTDYFAKIKLPDGSVVEPNKNLDLLKSDQYVLGYDKKITSAVNAKAELYYQNLYNVPVENSTASSYATINDGLEYRYVPLVNNGIGKNAGLEMTLERPLKDHYYFLMNGSLFTSKYRALDGVWRNTKFNSNYLFNALCGKEFDKLGRKQNLSLFFNVKFVYCGAVPYTPLLRDSNGKVAVDPANNKYWDDSKAYGKKLDDKYHLDLSVFYKISTIHFTHEFILDIGNITNYMGKISEYYDASKPDSISYITQLGFYPFIEYRITF